jgi:RNA polymerase sigma-70 factor (ECF subfamily)
MGSSYPSTWIPIPLETSFVNSELFASIESLRELKGRVGTSTQEALWVLRAQCGDRDALELLLRHVQPSLHRYVSRVVGPRHGDDALQEVLILIARKLTWLEQPELFRPWAFRIASRASFRYVKKERRWLEQSGDDVALEDVAAPVVRPPDELLQQLGTMDGISPASRAVLTMHFQEEMTLPDVAAILDIPLGTAKSRLAYGLAALRKQLGKNRSI